MMKKKIPTNSSVGPNASRISASAEVLAVVDSALIVTPLLISSDSSWPPFQNAGTCVAKSVVEVDEPAGYSCLTLKVPWTDAPLVVIEATRPCSTCWMKYG